MEKKITIPPKYRKEWMELVTTQIDHKFKNFVLQMKSEQYRKSIAAGKMTHRQAIDELYDLCEKYAVAVQNDFRIIFKEW